MQNFGYLLSISWEFTKLSQMPIHQIPNSSQSEQICRLCLLGLKLMRMLLSPAKSKLRAAERVVR